jgi:hypothetical protein
VNCLVVRQRLMYVPHSSSKNAPVPRICVGPVPARPGYAASAHRLAGLDRLTAAQVSHGGRRRDSPALSRSPTRARLLLVCADPAINSMLTPSARTRLCRPFQAPTHRGRFFMLNVFRYARGQHITHVPVEARRPVLLWARCLNRHCANSEQSLPPPALQVRFAWAMGTAHETDALWWPAKAKDTRRHARRGFGVLSHWTHSAAKDDY